MSSKAVGYLICGFVFLLGLGVIFLLGIPRFADGKVLLGSVIVGLGVLSALFGLYGTYRQIRSM